MSLCCETCGHMPSGCVCNMTFSERLRSIRLSNSVTATRTKRNNFDAEALADTFGPDARERYMDETKGLGAAYRDKTGRYMRRGDGRMVPVTDREMRDVYIRGEAADDVV